jgi:hypothetical protein
MRKLNNYGITLSIKDHKKLHKESLRKVKEAVHNILKVR